MYVEITLELFKKIVPSELNTDRTEYKETYSKRFYIVDGVEVVAINNYLSCVTQYYIKDINA